MKKLFILNSSGEYDLNCVFIDELGISKFIVLETQSVLNKELIIFDNLGSVKAKISVISYNEKLLIFTILQRKKIPVTLIFNKKNNSFEVIGKKIVVKGLSPIFLIADKSGDVFAEQKINYTDKNCILEIFDEESDVLYVAIAICINKLPTILNKAFFPLQC